MAIALRRLQAATALCLVLFNTSSAYVVHSPDSFLDSSRRWTKLRLVVDQQRRDQRPRTRSAYEYDLGLGKNAPVAFAGSNQSPASLSRDVQTAVKYWTVPEAAVPYPAPSLERTRSTLVLNNNDDYDLVTILIEHPHREELLQKRTAESKTPPIPVHQIALIDPFHQVDPNTIWVEMMLHSERSCRTARLQCAAS